MILNLNLKPPTLGLLKKPAKILLDITRVDADKKFVVCLAVDDQVVDHCTIAITHWGVDRLADRCIGDGIDYEPIQKECGITTKNMKLAHVADIEEANRFAHRFMLFEDTSILHGHIPPPKSDETCPLLGMKIVKRYP